MSRLITAVQRDLLMRHVGPFLFCMFTILFLLLMQFLILHIDKIVGKGIPAGIIFELIIVQLPYMVVLAVPMSVLVACLVAFGRFSESNELTALKAAGVSPWKLIQPVMVAALLITIFLAWFSNAVLPEANFKARSLFLDIRMKKPGFDLRPNTFYDGIQGYTFLVRSMSSESDTLYDVTIFQDASRDKEQAVIKAESGYLKGSADGSMLMLYLFDGSIMRYMAEQRNRPKRMEETYFGQYLIRFDLSDLAFSRTNPEIRRRDDRTMSSRAMLAVVDSLRREKNREIKTFYDQHSLVVRLPEDIASEDATSGKLFEITPQAGMANESDQLPAIESRYLALNYLKTLDQQVHATRSALGFGRNTAAQINALQTGIQWRTERIAQFMVEVHKKVSIPFACIIFVLVGATMGMVTKKGNMGFHAVLSTVLFTYYWITVIQGEKLADRLFISPFTGMWFGNITLGILGLFFLYRISTDFMIRDLWRKS